MKRLAAMLKPTPLEDRASNELPGWLLRLFGCPDQTPQDRSIDAWEMFLRADHDNAR